MATKPYTYASIGQQFHYMVEGTLGYDIHIIAVPTGWLFAIEKQDDTITPYQLIPDKDHLLNPRALIPPSWQDDLDLDYCLRAPPEHQQMADHLWSYKADEVRVLDGVFTMKQRIVEPDFVPTAIKGDFVDLKKLPPPGRLAIDGICRTSTVHRYVNDDHDMEVDLELGHRSDGTWQIRMNYCHYRDTLIQPADIQQAHVMMISMGFERRGFQTIKCNMAENPDEHPFLIPDRP